MTDSLPIHVGIICWTGKEAEASHIALSLFGHANKVTVIYSNSDNQERSGSGEWVQVPNSWFYGRKFSKFLSLIEDGSAGLIIQADASCDDWSSLLLAFQRTLLDRQTLGLWVPEIIGTPFSSKFNNLLPVDDGSNYWHVGLIDGIVWGAGDKVIRRLKCLTYEQNNLGWGIDYAAVGCAYSQGLEVLRTPSVIVLHIQGSGYSNSSAASQLRLFERQISINEKFWIFLVKLHHRLMAFSAGKLQGNFFKKCLELFILTLLVGPLRIFLISSRKWYHK